jgi:sugar/nucleoside kinase (ribokinase family)
VFAGVAAVDLIYRVARVPEENSKIMADQRIFAAGGPAANAAITFGFLGGQSTLVSAVGEHALASLIRGDLGRGNVELVDLAPPNFVPVVSSILVTAGTGRRTVVSSTGPPLTMRSAARLLDGASFLLVDGHHLSLAAELASQARAMNVPVILDGGSWKQDLDELLDFVDIAVCSSDFYPPGTADAAGVIRSLHNSGIADVAVTRGERPILFDSRYGGSGEVPVPQIQTVDTLGAGDILHGAFCYEWSRSASFSGALEYAARIASNSCRYFGPREWMNWHETPK